MKYCWNVIGSIEQQSIESHPFSRNQFNRLHNLHFQLMFLCGIQHSGLKYRRSVRQTRAKFVLAHCNEQPLQKVAALSATTSNEQHHQHVSITIDLEMHLFTTGPSHNQLRFLTRFYSEKPGEYGFPIHACYIVSHWHWSLCALCAQRFSFQGRLIDLHRCHLHLPLVMVRCR